MPRPEMISKKPVGFSVEGFDTPIVQEFLLHWDLISVGPRVVFQKDYQRGQDSQLTNNKLIIDLELHSVEINVRDKPKGGRKILAQVKEVSRIELHTRSGDPYITFESPDGFLVFQPQNMDIAITASKPQGYMLLR